MTDNDIYSTDERMTILSHRKTAREAARGALSGLPLKTDVKEMTLERQSEHERLVAKFADAFGKVLMNGGMNGE